MSPTNQTSTPAAAAQRPRVFAVEDDEATRESIVAFLKGRGYAVQAYASCEDLLADLDGTNHSCLLLDYHFEGMNGFELLDALRDRHVALRTILYTGRFDGGIRRQAAAYPEIVAFLNKPLGGTQLVEALDKALMAA